MNSIMLFEEHIFQYSVLSRCHGRALKYTLEVTLRLSVVSSSNAYR
jgi:hypothetical protein